VVATATNVKCTSTTVCTLTTPPYNPKGSGIVALVSVTVYGLTSPISDYTYTFPPATPPPTQPPPSQPPKTPPCSGICQ
jgi:hypothetical protein